MAETQPKKVALDAHMMSQCPDAQYCFNELLYPALKQISELVDFSIEFIGTVTPSGVACMHGPSECLGNMLHLCAISLSTPPDPPPIDRYIGFTKLLLDNYKRVTDKEFLKSAAEKTGFDFDELNKCVSSIDEDGGMEMLKRSVERSREAGVTKSCTVRIDGGIWCIRDGAWKECKEGHEVKDLVKAVKDLYNEKNSGSNGRVGLEGGSQKPVQNGINRRPEQGELRKREAEEEVVKGLFDKVMEERVVWRD